MSWKQAGVHREELVHWWALPPKWEMLRTQARRGAACLRNCLGDTWVGSLPFSSCRGSAWVLIGLPSKIPSFPGRLLKDSIRAKSPLASPEHLTYFSPLWDDHELWHLSCVSGGKTKQIRGPLLTRVLQFPACFFVAKSSLSFSLIFQFLLNKRFFYWAYSVYIILTHCYVWFSKIL